MHRFDAPAYVEVRYRESRTARSGSAYVKRIGQHAANFGPWLQRPTLQSGQHRAPPHAFRLDG
jgi:hypothetical protein